MVGAVIAMSAAMPTTAARAVEYALVVNSANTLADDASAQAVVRQLYLKERSEWPFEVDGKPLGAKPLGRDEESEEHAAFLQQVLGMTQTELDQHWLQVKQRRGETPPRDISSNELLLKMVARYPGGLGFVPKEIVDAANNEDIRVLFVTTGG